MSNVECFSKLSADDLGGSRVILPIIKFIRALAIKVAI